MINFKCLFFLPLCVSRTPEQCPSVVSLLSESYNPHVRCGAAMALGICCAGTGNKVSVFSFFCSKNLFCLVSEQLLSTRTAILQKKKTGRKHWILLAGLALEYRLICYQQHVFYKKRGKYLTMVSLVFSLLEVNRGLQPFKNCPVFQLCLMNYIDLSIELDLNFFSLLNMSLQSTYPSWSW